MKKILLSLFLLNIASVSKAQLYLEMSLGLTSASSKEFYKPSKLDDPSMGSIGIGLGYKLHPNFAIVSKYQSLYEQAAFTDKMLYGEKLSGPKIRSHATSIRAVGIVPINSFVSLNAKIGLGKTKITVGNAWSTNDINYGVGVDFFDKNNSLGFDIDFYPSNNTANFPSLKQTNFSVIAKKYF